jgi:hypothetical protein
MKYAQLTACSSPNTTLTSATPATGPVQRTASGCKAPRKSNSSPTPAAIATANSAGHDALPNICSTSSATCARNSASGRHELRMSSANITSISDSPAMARVNDAADNSNRSPIGAPAHCATITPATPKSISNATATAIEFVRCMKLY